MSADWRAEAVAGRRQSSLVAAGILLSRLSGFVRSAALAAFLGVGPILDAFTSALRIPNLLQNLLGEGVLSASFIPVYSRLLSQGRDEEAGKVAGTIAGLLTVVAGALVLIGVAFAAPLTSLLAPGFAGEKYDLTVRLVRIITPGIGFLVLSAWCLGVLNSHRRFFLSYVAPVVWNAAQIAALVGFALAGFADRGLVVALAWGTLVGGLLQFGLQLPAVLRSAPGLRPSLSLRLRGVRSTIRAFGPVVTGRGVVQLLTYVEILLASFLADGAVAALFLAQQLYVLPISLFGMSVAAAELPGLSRGGALDPSALRRRLAEGLGRIAFYVAPTAMAFFLLGDLIVAALFQRADFSAVDTVLVWLVLAGLSVGLLSNTSSRLLQSALYASGDTRIPAMVAVLRVAVAATTGGVLMLQLDRIAILAPGVFAFAGGLPAFAPLPAGAAGAPDALRLGAVGLGLAAGASSWIEFFLLRRRVARRLGVTVRPGGAQLPRVALAVAVAAVIAVVSRFLVADLHRVLAGVLACGATGIAYLWVAWLLGVEEARELRNSLAGWRRNR